MNAPQIIMIVLLAMSLGLSLANHGKQKEGKHNFFLDIFASGISFGLLYWGGFFK